jgi:hypothetical protein
MSARRLTLTALVIVISGAGVSPSASAAAITRGSLVAGGGDDWTRNDGHVTQRFGNGVNNRSSSTFNSPTINHGLQQVSNTNISGRTTTQVAFCKKKNRVCKISQKLWIHDW